MVGCKRLTVPATAVAPPKAKASRDPDPDPALSVVVVYPLVRAAILLVLAIRTFARHPRDIRLADMVPTRWIGSWIVESKRTNGNSDIPFYAVRCNLGPVGFDRLLESHGRSMAWHAWGIGTVVLSGRVDDRDS